MATADKQRKRGPKYTDKNDPRRLARLAECSNLCDLPTPLLTSRPRHGSPWFGTLCPQQALPCMQRSPPSAWSRTAIITLAELTLRSRRISRRTFGCLGHTSRRSPYDCLCIFFASSLLLVYWRGIGFFSGPEVVKKEFGFVSQNFVSTFELVVGAAKRPVKAP